MTAIQTPMDYHQEKPAVDEMVNRSVHVLMAYADIRHMKTLAKAMRMPPATLSRRITNQQGWAFREVLRLATYFHVSIDELVFGLPGYEEWAERRAEIVALGGSDGQTHVYHSDHESANASPANRGLTAEQLPGARRCDWTLVA